MTQNQKQAIMDLRLENFSYACIAEKLGLPMNTVKSYCFRHSVPALGNRKNKCEKYSLNICRYCGVRLEDNTAKQSKSFCCAKHRQLWWQEEYAKRARKSNKRLASSPALSDE